MGTRRNKNKKEERKKKGIIYNDHMCSGNYSFSHMYATIAYLFSNTELKERKERNKKEKKGKMKWKIRTIYDDHVFTRVIHFSILRKCII